MSTCIGSNAMTHDPKHIAAVAIAAYCHDGAKPYPWDSAARGDKYAALWPMQRGQAESIARAVLDLIGPKPLVWETDHEIEIAKTINGHYVVQNDDEIGAFYASLELGEHESPILIEPLDVTRAEAKAAAEAHHVAAFWAMSGIGGE